MKTVGILISVAVLVTVFVLPVVPGWVAKRKNRSFTRWFLFSFSLSFMPTFIPGFVVGLLAVYMLPPLPGKVGSWDELIILFRRWRRLAVPAIAAVSVGVLCGLLLWLAENGFFSAMTGEAPSSFGLRVDYTYVHLATYLLGFVLLLAAVIYQAVFVYKSRTDTLVDISLLSCTVVFIAASIVSGAIWAHDAWGTYWSWDPAETMNAIMFCGVLDALILNVIGRVLEPSRKGLFVGLVVNAVMVISTPVIGILIGSMTGCYCVY